MMHECRQVDAFPGRLPVSKIDPCDFAIPSDTRENFTYLEE